MQNRYAVTVDAARASSSGKSMIRPVRITDLQTGRTISTWLPADVDLPALADAYAAATAAAAGAAIAASGNGSQRQAALQAARK